LAMKELYRILYRTQLTISHSYLTRNLTRTINRARFSQASEDSLMARFRRCNPFLELIVSLAALIVISHGLVEGLSGDVEIEALRANVDFGAIAPRHCT